jgi:hypothetical protein
MKWPFVKSGTIAASQPATGQPKYYEAWGEALESVQFLKKLTVCLIFMNLLLLVLLRHAQQKPPLVIRVDEVGKAEPIKDVNATYRVSKPEVLNFTKLFMKYFLERNFYTWKDNLVEAGNMMTPEFREKANKEVNLSEEANAVEINKLTSKLNFSNIEVSRDTADHIIVALKGWRQITSYNDPRFLKETIFEGEMVLKKVGRTAETPYGLLVDSYKETVFKNE